MWWVNIITLAQCLSFDINFRIVWLFWARKRCCFINTWKICNCLFSNLRLLYYIWANVVDDVFFTRLKLFICWCFDVCWNHFIFQCIQYRPVYSLLCIRFVEFTVYYVYTYIRITTWNVKSSLQLVIFDSVSLKLLPTSCQIWYMSSDCDSCYCIGSFLLVGKLSFLLLGVRILWMINFLYVNWLRAICIRVTLAYRLVLKFIFVFTVEQAS